MWFDPTHNLKNLFNIWSSKKRFSIPLDPCDAGLISYTDYSHVVALEELEKSKTVKIAHSLSAVSLFPNSIQKTCPKHALSKLLN